MIQIKSIIMKLFLIMLLILTKNTFSQEVRTKDGVSIGKRTDFISDCTNGVETKLININGIEVEIKNYCACFCDKLIPNINSWDFEKAAKNNDFSELFLDESIFSIFMECIEKNVKLTDGYKFENSKENKTSKVLAVKSCVSEILNNNEDPDNFWTKEMAETYCECAITKMLNNGYTYKDLQEIEDENSTIYNEIVLPCIAKIFEGEQLAEIETKYDANDILGDKDQSIISLMDNLGQGFKIKISIGNVQRYFLFDTGATDLIIDRNTERELLLEGILKRENYLEKSEYKLANNQLINAQMIRVDNVQIGDFVVNNVIIGIFDEGSLLCGKSFLDKFKKWELDSKNKVLILYK